MYHINKFYMIKSQRTAKRVGADNIRPPISAEPN